MSFLDIIDNPSYLATILGGGGEAAAPPPVPVYDQPQPPVPLPREDPRPTGLSGRQAQDGGSVLGGFSDLQSPWTSGGMVGMEGQVASAGVPADVPLPTPRPPVAADVPLPTPRPAMTSDVPLPRPRQDMTAGQPGQPMSLAPTHPGNMNDMIPPNARPANEVSPSGMRPPKVEGRGWRGLLDDKQLDSPEKLMGLGRGLSAVAQNYNKPGLAAAAGTAGATLEGQGEEALKQKKINFDQQSTYFKDMLAQRKLNNDEAYRAAQSKYLAARAKALTESGGSTGWQATPWGKVIVADKTVQEWLDGRMKAKREEWKSDFTDKATREKETAELEAEAERRRGVYYQRMGINPQQAGAMRNMGTQAPGPDGKFPDNAPPFDARTMSQDMFDAMVPLGAYYLGHDGKAYKRTKPPKQRQSQNDSPNYDDATAMAG